MTRASAAAGTLVFLVVAPGVVAGLVPWLLTGAVIGTFAVYLGWIVPEYGAIPPWQMLLLAVAAAGALIGARVLGL